MSCETHTTPAFGCSGCIDARKRGEWESAPVRTVRHDWTVPGIGKVSVTSWLRVPDGATGRDVERECWDLLVEKLINKLEPSLDWLDADAVKRSKLRSLYVGGLVERTPEPEPIADQPSLFGGGS